MNRGGQGPASQGGAERGTPPVPAEGGAVEGRQALKALVPRADTGVAPSPFAPRSSMQRADEIGKRAEYLAFRLGPEAYGVEIGDIVEILKPLPITEVPRANPEVVGVMSVRGRLVTVLDLKRRFKLAPSFMMDKKSRILLVQAADEEIGLLVDQVLQVYRLSEGEIEPPAVLGTEQPLHVVGIGRPQGGAVLMLLDLAPLLAE